MGPANTRDDERRRRFEQLFRDNYSAVQSFVRSRFPTSDCEAVMSTTFEVAWRRLDDIPGDAMRGWLIGVARNSARNDIRGSRRRAAATDALVTTVRDVTAAPAQITAAEREALGVAWRRLSESDRELLLLADWDDLPNGDIAVALGVSTSAAAVRLHRARQRLRAAYAEGSER